MSDEIDRLLNDLKPTTDTPAADCGPLDLQQALLRLATISFAFITPKDEVETEHGGDYIRVPVVAMSAFLATTSVFYRALKSAGIPHAVKGGTVDDLLMEVAKMNVQLDNSTPKT